MNWVAWFYYFVAVVCYYVVLFTKKYWVRVVFVAFLMIAEALWVTGLVYH